MYIRQLECFVQLCETLNFNTTAELLYISQPAVSHQIKTLEEELGLKLFIRSKRKVRTLAYRQYLRQAHNTGTCLLSYPKDHCHRYR